MKENQDYKVSNIVASTEICDELDVQKISLLLDNCEYEPEVYSALIYRISKPKLSVLVNKSGKIIFTGGKSLEDIEIARDIFFKDLRKLGYNPIRNDIKIQNMIILIQLELKNQIRDIINKYNLNIDYRPEIFPAGILKNKDPKFTALIFNSGKISLTGLKDLNHIDNCISILKNQLHINE